ncbi:type II secretion system protein [Limnohabitans sp. WS1]|uniref:type II secretion system protein n=1 Tax=Limnohabitans sp. WS1 TaxID=1100726 RepID=UPI00130494BA|nr:prepilin-type N-terminal cleavage/methylation domain-containing protein [Limnohabitans sp. WS1]
MKRNLKPAGKQRGFTLVEMSVTMAAAGLLFSAVTTGQELIDQAKATKLINDVKTVEMQIQQYAQLKGRMPGDCDADGVIDYKADENTTTSLRTDTGNNSRASEYAYTVALPTIPADGAAAAAQTAGCALMGAGTVADVAASTSNANVWLNDLKLAGVVSDSASNRKLAKLVHEDFMFVGKVTDAGGGAAVGADYNAIVIHNVPQWMARRLSTSINGQDSRADRTRVRLLQRETSTAGTYSQLWQTIQMDDDAGAVGTTTTATRDGMVTVVYFFDRIPESKAGATASTTPV